MKLNKDGHDDTPKNNSKSYSCQEPNDNVNPDPVPPTKITNISKEVTTARFNLFELREPINFT